MDNYEQELNDIKSKLNEILTLVATPKQWLNTNEVAHYLGYSTESIKKMVKNKEFELGTHYHKKVKRLLFDRTAIDTWVVSKSPVNNTTYDEDVVLEDILSSISA